jgi:hypothetical protein
MKRLIASPESYNDYRVYTRVLNGLITPLRLRILLEFARRFNSVKFGGCGHDFDCCGCLCGQHMDVHYNEQSVTIRVTYSYNY